MAGNNFDDKQILTDALSTQKMITSNYNNFVNESATPEVRNDVMNILSEEHQIEYSLFSEMQRRGWYQVTQAEQQKVMQAKNKFAQAVSQPQQ